MHNKILDFLKDHQIPYLLHEHPPFFKVEESKHFDSSIEGASTKNLFLKDRKNTFFLVSVLSHKRVDLKTLSKSYGKGGLSFAKEEELKRLLHLTPGSVTPYGLINDKENEVHYLLDKEFLLHETINFHPLRNDMTIGVTMQNFLKFCALIQHSPELIEITS